MYGSRLWVRFRNRERVVGVWFRVMGVVWDWGEEGGGGWFRVGVPDNMVYCGIIILTCTATTTTTTLNPTIAT